MAVRFARFDADVHHQTPDQGLCVSSFLLLTKDKALLLGRLAKPEWAKGKWAMPASQLLYGESPEEAVKRVAREQLGLRLTRPRLVKVLSFTGTHWDLCFVYRRAVSGKPRPAKAPLRPSEYFLSSQVFDEIRFFSSARLPYGDLGRGHGDVLKELLRISNI